MGFTVSHSLLTLMFEQSMRLVNPKLSLPYWDYTVEGYLVDKYYDGDFTRINDVTQIFSDEWFGAVEGNQVCIHQSGVAGQLKSYGMPVKVVLVSKCRATDDTEHTHLAL